MARLIKVMEARKHVSKSSAVLLLAARRNCVTIVELLVEAGVDVNYQDENGETALHHAARLGHTKCIQALCPATEVRKRMLSSPRRPTDGPLYSLPPLLRLDRAEHAALRGHLDLAKMLIKKRTQNPDKLSVTASSSPKLSSSPGSDKNIPPPLEWFSRPYRFYTIPSAAVSQEFWSQIP
ncbi:hypothetical protein BZA77DRAFT_369024 [Pyronema omphalodes]|nr:hypothetical protein BZA77DRAFT_369024 [Pyronema omphalodes]